MDTLTIRVKYRPLRIGWCLTAGDIDGLRKAFQLSHTMWGGRYNPVIPVNCTDLATKLVRLFRVDLLIPVSNNKQIETFIKGFPYLPNPLFPPELFIKESRGHVYPKILDLYHPVRRLYEKYYKGNPKPTFKAATFECSEGDPLSNILLATFGGFPATEVTGTDYSALIEQDLKAEKIVLREHDPLPSDSFKKFTPNRICCLCLMPHISVINYKDTPGFYVGSAIDFDDLVNYWNLRAANIELAFYYPALAERQKAAREALLKELQEEPKRGREPTDAHVSIWYKRNDNPIDFGEFGQELVINPLSNETGSSLNVKVPIMHFGEKSVLATIGRSSGKTRVTFALPEKPCFANVRPFAPHLVASITPVAGLYGNGRETFKTPFLPELNEFYGRHYHFGLDKARAEPGGTGIIIDDREENLTLSALDVATLFSKIFEAAGIRACPSRAGLVTSRLIQQLGGLQGCRVFKIGGVRDLIEKYSPDKSFTRSAAVQAIRQVDNETGEVSFTKHGACSFRQDLLGSKLKPEDVLTYLLEHSVFRVGLQLECPNCLLAFWISLDDVKTQTKCEYCGGHFDIAGQLKDRDWRYRRSGLFGKENSQEGAIPVALTLQQMNSFFFADHEMLYSTSLKLVPAGASIQVCETDFAILTHNISNRKVQIAIGECKTRGEITDEDVSKLRMVAEALENKGIATFVIFAKLSEFSPDELWRCKGANNDQRRRLILFTPRELEPYQLYERTAQEFDISKIAISFEDMVNVTQAVFYEKCIKNPQRNQER